MAVTSQDIANQALQLVGNNMAAVTGQAPSLDNSTAGLALQRLYVPCVRTVGRKFGWDFARNLFTLTLSGNAAPPMWAYEYVYPPFGVEVWQLVPSVISDANNPLPQRWSVGNNLVAAVQTKVLWSNLANALCYYNNNPSEASWDPGFREAVVRLLASELAMAIAGKPDTMQSLETTFAGFDAIAETRPD